ncbi:DEAD/DEAH box helicase, partial [Parasphingorhabdus sp.]|uniref:DEAD/DEAH box helicase n=1 Tax=Parasphingorhabdus sp. TaxID=2709688 RepID=UPI0032669A9D
MTVETIPSILTDWFAARGWAMRQHQLDMLQAAQAGRHALLTAPTGAGKTLAGFLPTLVDLVEQTDFDGLHTLYISPLKALAVDVQRNLLTPIEEMGLPISVETRSGDTPANRKARQRVKPPQILLTTPESLNLLLSQPESLTLFAGLRRVVIDEVHAFATGKRGDLLALSLARLQRLAPKMQRVALSATVADPDDFRAWLAPYGDIDSVTHVQGAEGAAADLSIMLPETPESDPVRVPWSGHAGTYAMPQVMEQIRSNRMTLIFCNTRFLAEFTFQKLWDINDETLAIGIHHGSLSKEARRKVEGAMARGRMRALVCTASLDLGVDWGDIDCVIQMG